MSSKLDREGPGRPLVALTMGDVAGIGPEVIARAWSASPLHSHSKPFVIGDVDTLRRALRLIGSAYGVVAIETPEEAELAPPMSIPCLQGTTLELANVVPGRVDPDAGRAAYDFLVCGIDLALAGRIDAIVTLPLNKESLHAGGILVPGHTEILAERCASPRHAMMLYLPREDPSGWSNATGLGVVHVTLHVALRRVFELISIDSVTDAIGLADSALRALTEGRPPRVGVAGLNPHAGEGGLFGDEEIRIITPAVEQARGQGINACGPIAADTLFHRAVQGEFDAVVAMYHDQGHVAIKTVGFDRAVNVTLGLPIVRTSVAHGTAFDIAWQGRAETSTSSLISAIHVATQFVSARRRHP